MTGPEAYTVEEVEERLRLSHDAVYGLLRPYDNTAALRSIKIGRSRRVTPEQLSRYLKDLENEQEGIAA